MPKLGDKYIIEIGEVYETLENSATVNDEQLMKPTFLYRIKGFNSLVFDETGLNKLEKYDAEAEYQRGLDDAWECARKIFGVKYGYTHDEIIGIYGRRLDAIDLPPSEAIEKIRKYEEQKKAEEDEADNIKVGDEVIFNRDEPFKVVVTCVKHSGGKSLDYTVMADNGLMWDFVKPNEITKTGRHFSGIADVLEKMKEGEG